MHFAYAFFCKTGINMIVSELRILGHPLRVMSTNPYTVDPSISAIGDISMNWKFLCQSIYIHIDIL